MRLSRQSRSRRESRQVCLKGGDPRAHVQPLGVTGMKISRTAFPLSAVVTILLNCCLLVPESRAGYEWTPVGPNGGIVAAIRAIPSSPEILICGLENGGAYRSTDGGQAWYAISDIPPDTKVNDISLGPFEGTWLIYLSSPSGLYRSGDLGMRWDQIVGEPVLSVEAGDAGVVLGEFRQSVPPHYSGEVFRLSYDRGESWEEEEQLLGHTQIATFSLDGQVIYRYHIREFSKAAVDDLQWEQISREPLLGGSPRGMKVSPADPAEIYVYEPWYEVSPGYGGGYLKRSRNGGVDWESLGLRLVTALEIAPSTGHVLVGDGDGELYLRDESSASWITLARLESEVRCIDPVRWERGILTVGTLSGIFQTSDAGASWARSDQGIPRFTTSSLTFLPGLDDGVWLSAGLFGGAFISSDGAESWTPIEEAPAASPGQVAVAPSDPRTVYIGGPESLHKSEDGGRSWTLANRDLWVGSSTVSLAVSPVDANHIVASFENQQGDYTAFDFVETRDGWETWISSLRGRPEGAPDSYVYAYDPFQTSPHQVVFDLTGNKLYLLQRGIVVVNLTDGTQTTLNGDRRFDTTAIGPRRPQRMYAVEAVTGARRLWCSDDGGASWDDFEIAQVAEVRSVRGVRRAGHLPGYFAELRGTSPGQLTIDPHREGRLFFACYGNGVFVSEDSGQTWVKANDGLPNLDVHSVAISASRPSEVFVATFSGVYRLQDTGPDAVTSRQEVGLPRGFALSQNHPNPFNSFTTIRLAIPDHVRRATVTIHTLCGQKVRTLVDEPIEAGRHSFVWDGTDDLGGEVGSGAYVYRLTADGLKGTETKKMVLIR